MAFYVLSVLGATRLVMRVSSQSRDREMEVRDNFKALGGCSVIRREND